VIWAVSHEMARTVENILAKKGDTLLLDAHAISSPQATWWQRN
jgi:hypothetical protein